MDFLRRMVRRTGTRYTAADAVEALLNGGSVEDFLDYAAAQYNSTNGGAASPHTHVPSLAPGLGTGGAGSDSPARQGAVTTSAVGGAVEAGAVVQERPDDTDTAAMDERDSPLLQAMLTALRCSDTKRVRAVVKLLARDTQEASPEDPNTDLGTAQAYHPLTVWILNQPSKATVQQFVHIVLDLVESSDQASMFYAAESALAAITDAAHQRDGQEVMLSMSERFMEVVCKRLRGGVNLREDEHIMDEDDTEELYHDEMPMGPGDSQPLSSIAEAVMMLLNSRQPPNHWFLYPGWNPGTLVFVLERLFGLYGDDQEIENVHLNVLIERMISLLHGEHNLRAHVAGNAACALSQLCRTKGGMARVLTHVKADSMSEAIGNLLSVQNLPPNNYTSRIVTKWVGNLAEAEEGAPWLFGRPLEVRKLIMGSLVRLLSSDDFQTATEASHALAQLLLYSEPDTNEGDAQRNFLYGLDSSERLPHSLANLMEGGADPIENDGPLESGHHDRYLRGYAAAEEACVVVAEMIYDKEGGELLLKAAPELVSAVYGLLSSRDPDCAIAGANVLSRMADLANKWGNYLLPSMRAVSALTALLVHQSAHRHALPALSKVLSVKGWLHALLEHEQFAVLVAWLVSELDPEDGGGDPASASVSGAHDAEASWAAGTLATIAAGSPEGAQALLDGPDGEEMVHRLLALLRRRDVRHAAAAALGPLQAASESVREQLLRTVEGRGDGVALALLERGGVSSAVLDEQLKGLELAEKRAWMGTQLQQLHHPLASIAAAQGLMGPVEIEISRSDLLQHMCSEHQQGRGLKADLRSGVTVRFAGESGQGAAIRREWFCLSARELLNPDHNLFVSRNAGASFQPSPVAHVTCEEVEQYMEMAGRVIGLALLHAVPLDCRFTRAFLRQVMEQDVELEDMEEADPEVYRHKVRYLLDNPYPDYLELEFTDVVDDTGVLMRDQEVDLVAGGSGREVCEENKGEYIDALVQWRMKGAIAAYTAAFKNGLNAVVPSELMRRIADFVSPAELGSMIAGLQEVDIEDWKANTRYEGDAMTSADSEQVKWFWSMVDGMSEEERRAVLQFATASPNVPVGGFAQLQSATGTLHPFTLSELTGRAATNTLPRAAACFNTLYLPVFKSEEQMKSQIKVAIGMGKGHFDENAVVIGRGVAEENLSEREGVGGVEREAAPSAAAAAAADDDGAAALANEGT